MENTRNGVLFSLRTLAVLFAIGAFRLRFFHMSSINRRALVQVWPILLVSLIAGCSQTGFDHSEAPKSQRDNRGSTNTDKTKQGGCVQAPLVDELIAEFETEFAKWLVEAKKADPSQLTALLASSPKISYGQRLKRLAADNAGTEDAAKALCWLAANTFGQDKQSSLNLLFSDYEESEGIHGVCETLSAKPCQSNHDKLLMLFRNSPHRIVQAASVYSILQMIETAEMMNSQIDQIKSSETDAAHFGAEGIKYIEEVGQLKDAKVKYLAL
ncbi:MAG: hypothetical protein AAF483_26220, partial [Planctomycetota bacterium]